MPEYFQAPATQDSTSPLTSTSGSATDMISIQPQNNTFLFFKKKKKKRKRAVDLNGSRTSHHILFCFTSIQFFITTTKTRLLMTLLWVRPDCFLWLVTRCLSPNKQAVGRWRSFAFLQLRWHATNHCGNQDSSASAFY